MAESILLDILLVINVGFLFGWYYAIISRLNFVFNLSLKYFSVFKAVGIYTLLYLIAEILPVQNDLLNAVIWQYLAFLGYLFIVGYVTVCFDKAEKKKGKKDTNALLSFVLFFMYPVGVFFITKRLKEMLNLKN